MMESALTCPACGSEVTAVARFCSACGVRLEPRCRVCASPCNPEGGSCEVCRVDGTGVPFAPASYTPPHLAGRILTEGVLMEGERKRVSVLFADVVGSTAAIEGVDPEEAARYLGAAVSGMMAAVHRFEGMVNELRGDGIMALFGAPVAHEDHAINAARAALAIPAEVAAVTGGRAKTRVGVHAGDVLVRQVRSDLSLEYVAQGHTVHLAARMESLALPGTAYVTGDFRRMIRGRIETRRVGPVELKGVSAPVEVFELVRTVDVTNWQAREAKGLTEFRGRQQELERLTDMAMDACAGDGCVVAVIGQAGMGKSRLVHEFLEGTDLSGSTLLKADASPFDTNTPYALVITLVQAAFESASSDPAFSDRLRADLDAIDPLFLVALKSLTDGVDEDVEWQDLSPSRRRRVTRDAIGAVFATLGRRSPLIVVVEDLHWVDEQSKAVLTDLMAMTSQHPIMLVATYRPDFEESVVDVPMDRLNLEPLPNAAVRMMLDDLLGTHPSLDRLKPRLASRAAGTPLYLEETIQVLAERGVLQGERGGYVAVSGDVAVEIPDSVQALLAARIDRLDPVDKRVLQVASVTGEPVPLVLAGRVLGMSDDAVLAALERLQDRQLIAENSPGQFGFGHALVRDVAYESVLRDQRRDMHAQIARAMEGDADASVERLALHAAAGELWEAAVGYSLAAADRAIDRSAYREASTFLRQAVRCLGRLPQTHGVVEAAIDARMRLRVAETGDEGGLSRIVSDLAEAVEMARSIGDKTRIGRASIHHGYALELLGYFRDVEDPARRAMAVAEELGDPDMFIESQMLLGQSRAHAGKPKEVAPLIEPHMDYLRGEARGDTKDQLMIRSVTGCVYLAAAATMLGDHDLAQHWEEVGMAIAEEAGRPADLVYVFHIRGHRLDFQGDPGAALAAFEECERLANDHGIWLLRMMALPWHGHALWRAGRHETALEMLTRGAVLAQQNRLPFIEATCRGIAALVRRSMGDLATAVVGDDASAALEFGLLHDSPLLETIGLQGLGRSEEAAEVVQRWGLWALSTPV